MKKFLTILSLALVLCLVCSAALAVKYDELSEENQALVQEKWDAYKDFLNDSPATSEEDAPDVFNAHLNDVDFTVTDATCSEEGLIEIDFHKVDYENDEVVIEKLQHSNIVTKYFRLDNDEEVDEEEAKKLGCTTAILAKLYCEDCGEELATLYIEKGDHDSWSEHEFWDDGLNDEIVIGEEDDPEHIEFLKSHWGYWTALVCDNCGEIDYESAEWVEPTEGHWFGDKAYFIILGGVRVYEEEDWETYHKNECTCEVWYEWKCPCGARNGKVEKLYGVRNHTYGTEEYVVRDTATGDDLYWMPGGIDEQKELCMTVRTNETLVKVTRCATCGVIMKEVTIGAGRVNPKTGAAGHVWATGAANDAAHWAKIIEQPTCRYEGLAVSFCTLCGEENWNMQYAIAKLDHQYTVKVYNCAAAPTCKNGLTVKYTLKCILCRDIYGVDYYEGGKIYPSFDHSEKLTPVELINLDMAHKNGTNSFEYANGDSLLNPAWIINTDIDGKPTYDDEGHFYIPTVMVERKYACEPEQMQYYSCVFCGKEKLVWHEASWAMNRPDFKLIKTEDVDATTVKQTWQCRICNGEFEPHTYTKIVDKDCAHSWVYQNDTLVVPTCTTAGSIVKICAICGKEAKDTYSATGHVWGEWELVTAGTYPSWDAPENSRVYIQTCQVCGETQSKIVPPDQKFETKNNFWKKIKDITGDCVTFNGEVWAEYKVDATTGEVVATGATKEYLTGLGNHIMAHKVDLDVPATCTSDGIEYYVCTVCGGYDTTKKAFYGYYETKVIPGGHKWGEWAVTTPATTEAAGIETRECSVCGLKETREIDKVVGEAAYKLTDIKFAGTVLTGKITHVEGTKEADKLSIRVTFFTAGNHYMTTSAVIYADGTFEAEGAGDIEAITLVAYATDKVVNPADVADLTKLDAAEIVVK